MRDVGHSRKRLWGIVLATCSLAMPATSLGQTTVNVSDSYDDATGINAAASSG